MMNTGEIYTRHIATVGKDASVVRAAAIMRQHHVHDLVTELNRIGQPIRHHQLTPPASPTQLSAPDNAKA